MKFNSLARVAIAITLVASIGASLWFASPPLRLRAFDVEGPVANSSISGNTTYLLGEKVTIAGGIEFDASEYKTFDTVAVSIAGPESFSKSLPIVEGSYSYSANLSGTLDVTITWDTGVGTFGYGVPDRYGYGYSSGTGNITYAIQWTPPYTLSNPPTPPPAALPALEDNFSVSLPAQIEQQLDFPSTDAVQGMTYDSTNEELYFILPGGWNHGSDVIIRTDIDGEYVGYIDSPAQNTWETSAVTFVDGTLYAGYNEWDNTTQMMGGKVKSWDATNLSWETIQGLSNLESIGGLASDGTYLFVAYRDQLRIDKRDPSTGTQIAEYDLSDAWQQDGGAQGGMGQDMGMNMQMGGPPIWGFDALAYDDGADPALLAAQNNLVIYVDATTGDKSIDDYKTGQNSIRGLTIVSENFNNTAFNILYAALETPPSSKISRASMPGTENAPFVENTPIGSYTTLFEAIIGTDTLTTHSDASAFTLTKKSSAPEVTISAPSQNFAKGAGAEEITVSGSIDDPSITAVTVGIALPEVTAFTDDMETEAITLSKWTTSIVTGDSQWMMYDSTADFWHHSDEKSHTGGSNSWRYANETTGNYHSGMQANAGALQTTSAVNIGTDNALTFWTYYDTEFDFWPDRKVVEVSTDNTTWEPVAWLSQFWPPFQPMDVSTAQYETLISVQPQQWEEVEVDLGDYAGQNIYIRFRFDTMDDWGNHHEGWYIDDVSISGAGFQGVTAAIDASLQFSTTFTLAEGENVISVTAARTSYAPLLTGTASVTGSLDTVASIINLNPVTTPSNNQYQTIAGNVTETNFERLMIYKNDVLKYSTTVLGTGDTFSQSILLTEGTNNIMVKVTDSVGLAANVTATIELDTTGPVFGDVFTGRYDVAYKTGEISARSGDEFFIALKVTDAASTVASVQLQGRNNSPLAISTSTLPDAVIDNWGFSAATKAVMNYVIPMQLPANTPAGDFSWVVTATDSAGNSANLTVDTSVVTTLEAFNIYLMPDWNLVSTPVIPTSTNIATLMASANATGLFERAWYYDSANTTDPWKLYEPGAPSDLTTFETGNGYWIKMKPLVTAANTTGIDSFTEAGRVSGPMAAGLPNTPAPVKLSITGPVLQPGASVPPTYDVVAGWNLVGLHSEDPRPVSTALQSLTVPQQKWGSLLQYLNFISFPIDQSTPQIDLGRFDRLIAADDMQPGRGFWLYMVEAGTIVP